MTAAAEERDERHMRRALELARRGGVEVFPNPQVGCVIARGEEVLAEGFHARFGGPHAERAAFDALEARGESASGASVYVTLEPCSHHGKTGPCAELLRGSGIARVVIAQRDPNPLVDGRGVERLARAGIEVVSGVLEEEARALNARFNKFMITQRPLVTAKWAMSLDGKIAARTGDSKWITGAPARKRVHELRGLVDAVVVGVGTALRDDPRLTRRDAEGLDPVRVVVDSRARLPRDLGLVATAKETPTYLVTTHLASEGKVAELRAAGLNVIRVPNEGQRVDIAAMLDEFGRRGWQHILLEGGGELLGSFFNHDLIDEIWCFIAPKVIGGSRAPTPAGGMGVAAVKDALSCGAMEVEALGEDLLLKARPHRW